MLPQQLVKLQLLIDKYNINLIHGLFIGFTLIIVVFGSLVKFIESRLPRCIRQSFRYGKHCYKGESDPLVAKLEVPKSWFKHFYIFAFVWALLALFLVLKGFIMHTQAPEIVLVFLDFMAGGPNNRRVQVSSSSAIIAAVLMTMQCGRRFYETNFVQIFSRKSKMNLSHYLVGFLHYFGAILSLLANTEGFVRGTQPSTFSYTKITLLQYLCIFVFHFGWTHQYKSNMILVNLRKNAKDKVVTEAHFMPKGGFFEFISSPHMFFEVVMYIVLLGIMSNCTTWYLIAGWVFSNQVMNAILTHEWYKDNFNDYPKNRRAIIPFIL